MNEVIMNGFNDSVIGCGTLQTLWMHEYGACNERKEFPLAMIVCVKLYF